MQPVKASRLILMLLAANLDVNSPITSLKCQVNRLVSSNLQQQEEVGLGLVKFPNGNYKACSLDKLWVRWLAQVEDLRQRAQEDPILTPLSKLVKILTRECLASTVVVNLPKLQQRDIYRTAKENIRRI